MNTSRVVISDDCEAILNVIPTKGGCPGCEEGDDRWFDPITGVWLHTARSIYSHDYSCTAKKDV